MSAQAHTAKDLFNQFLPLGILAYPERIREINGVFLFRITGEGGGEWQLDCCGTPPKVHSGEAIEGSGVTIELSHEDFQKLMTDHNYGMDLYLSGRLKITGDMAQAVRLGMFFDITRPNPG